MEAIIDVIGGWVIAHEKLRHLSVALGIILQGELTAFISVTLILKNYLTWAGYFLSALGGIVLYDGFLFSLGKALQNKPLGEKWERKIKGHRKMSRYIRENLGHLLIISRFLLYVNVAAVILAGLTNMKVKEFLKNRLFADILWISVLTLGSYLILSGLTLLKLRHFEIGIAIFLILAFAVHALFKRIFAKKSDQSSRPG